MVQQRPLEMHRNAYRARGMELVSPDDLRAAAEHFAPLRLPVRFRQFPSGVAVVQDESWSDGAACERILRTLDALEVQPQSTSRSSDAAADSAAAAPPSDADGGAYAAASAPRWAGLRPTQYAVAVGVPVAVAREQLLLAERGGVLCRDDAAAGLAFFRNIFPSLA